MSPGVEATPQAGALCAAHEGAQSTGTCARCGNFVCPLCLDEFSGLPDHCEACREREGGGIIAFEREGIGLLSRWWMTTRDVVTQPTRTFETTRVGAVQRALGYAALTGAMIGLVISACGGCALGLLAGSGYLGEAMPDGEDATFAGVLAVALVLYVVIIPAGLLLSSVLRAGVFHAVARLLGGEASFATSLWATSYLHAISLVWLPTAVLQQIPLIGPLLGLGVTLLTEAFYALQLTTVARHHHRLPDGRAALAGWAGFLTFTVLAGVCCLAGFLLAFSDVRA